MAIRKRPSAKGTRYLVTQTVRDPETGRNRTLTEGTFDTLAEAKVADRKLAGRSHGTARNETFGDVLMQWEKTHASSWSPVNVKNTHLAVERVVRPRFGERKITKITTRDLDAWYVQLGESGGAGGKPLAPATVRRIHAIVSSALAQAVKWRLIAENPAERCTLPRVDRPKVTAPRIEDVIALLDEARFTDPDFHAFLHVAAATGARRGELCALRWTDLDLEAGRSAIERGISSGDKGNIEVPTKTRGSRTIKLDPSTIAVLRAHRARCAERSLVCGVSLPADAFVWSEEPDGSRCWRPDSPTQHFGRLRASLGLTTKLHDLRHFHITRLLSAGLGVADIAERVGHAGGGRTTLSTYAHAVREADDRAAEVIGDVLPAYL